MTPFYDFRRARLLEGFDSGWGGLGSQGAAPERKNTVIFKKYRKLAGKSAAYNFIDFLVRVSPRDIYPRAPRTRQRELGLARRSTRERKYTVRVFIYSKLRENRDGVPFCGFCRALRRE